MTEGKHVWKFNSFMFVLINNSYHLELERQTCVYPSVPPQVTLYVRKKKHDTISVNLFVDLHNTFCGEEQIRTRLKNK